MALLEFSRALETRSNPEQVGPSIIRLFVSENATAQYFAVALATVLVYHSIITFEKEIRYFWGKPNPRSSVSIIYFANRYIGLLSAICNITDVISVLLIDYILLIRVSSLFHQDKRLGIMLKVLLGLEACMDFGILIYGHLFQGAAVFSLVKGTTVCGTNRPPPQTLAIVSWLVPVVYGMILLVLALYKAAEYWKLSSGFKGFHLVRVLIQDQVIYYGLIIAISIFEISPFAANALGAAGSPTLLCILGGQLLINLKEAGERGANGGTNYSPSKSVSDIDFGENDVINEQGTGLMKYWV
ncbi:hypothetical protein ACEPAG_2266 [Sanghuangporus baumii]